MPTLSKSKLLLISTYILAANSIKFEPMLRRGQDSCKPLDVPCSEDCECCEWDNPSEPRKCEIRNKPKGYRCYKSYGLGYDCNHDHDCRSQKCINGRCVPHFTGQKYPKCSLSKNHTSVEPVIGTIKDNACNCTKPIKPTVDDVKNAVDEDEDTIYVNNWATDGGIMVTPARREALHSFKVCNSDDCPNCDPTCYKLEGYCDFRKMWVTIQDGPLFLPTERNQCVTIRTKGKPLYTSYRLTFPCQRGTCRDSCMGQCHAAPLSNPELGPCENHVDDPALNFGSMAFVKKNYEAITDRTVFFYSLEHIDLYYARLAWEGDCMVDYYYVYEDLNGDGKLQGNEMCCFPKCGDDFVQKDELGLCMEGLMITSESMQWKPAKYIIAVFIIGDVGTTMLPYGMIGKGANGAPTPKFGSNIMSPKCPEVLCEATCPLKLSDVSLYTQECTF